MWKWYREGTPVSWFARTRKLTIFQNSTFLTSSFPASHKPGNSCAVSPELGYVVAQDLLVTTEETAWKNLAAAES